MAFRQRTLVVLLILSNVIVFAAVAALVADRIGSGITASAAPAAPVAFPSVTPAGASTLSPTAMQASPGPSATVSSTSPSAPPALTAPSARSAVAPAGWTSYGNAADGFSLAVPSGWQLLDVSPVKLKQTLEAIREKNPEIAADLEEQSGALFRSGFEFFAYDASAGPPAQTFLTNVNVVADPMVFPVSLETYVQFSLDQLAKLKSLSTPVMHRRVTLAAGPAEVLSYGLMLPNSHGALIQTRTIQYLLVHDRTAYILSLTTTEAQAPDYAATFEQIAATWTWTRP